MKSTIYLATTVVTFVILFGLVGISIYDLYWGDEGIKEVTERRQSIVIESSKLNQIAEENHQLAREVQALQTDEEYLEGQIRQQLGVIGADETYIQPFEPKQDLVDNDNQP